jgi:2-methylisocitrate lyase-like PEP mutase family enzyme
VVLNARIDTIIRSPDRDPAGVLGETIGRAQLYRDAGADCVYPIGLRDPEIVKQITDAVDVAVNVNPSVPLKALVDAGAARISFGAGAFMSMMTEFQRRAEAALAGDLAAFA